ncbi:MAG: NAD(P)/FAD-dependent oxidoreductase [Candidatus Hadarchaeales archaeon]
MCLTINVFVVNAAVVGAGVAGLTCAIFAAKGGAEVTVYERRYKIGFPVRSTGGIAKHYLERSGVGFREDFAYPLYRAIVASPSGYTYEFEMKGDVIGYVIDHGEFEKYLYEKALEHGVRVMTGMKVDERLIRQLISTYDFVVGADGPYSTVRRFLGIPDENPLDMHKGYEVWVDGLTDTVFPVPPNSILIWFNNDIAPRGYVWFFRYKDIIKVGLGVPVAHPEDPKTILERNSSRIFPNGMSPINRIGGVIPTPPPLESVVYGNVALVGDAGNLINSATGGGIHMALFSGRACGESIAQGSLRGYSRWYDERGRPLLQRWYRVKQMIYSMDNGDFDSLVSTLSGFRIKSLEPHKELVRLMVHVLVNNPTFLLQLIPTMIRMQYVKRRLEKQTGGRV